MRKPRALRPGDRVAVVAPGSPFARDQFDAGIAELRQLGFDPVYEEAVFARASGYLAGSAELRARDWQRAWNDPDVAALIAARGGYGSVQILPLLDPDAVRRQPKAFIGYSDNTSLLSWLTRSCGIVAFHGPMIEGRFARGAAGYDRDSFLRCVTRPEPVGEITHPEVEALRPGEASGMLVGGTLTQLVGSLGTPYAFDPPADCVLFLDEVAERPYRLDRMLTQLRLSGLMARASAMVFGELPRCDEPGGDPAARAVVADIMRDFPGPVLFGLPSGHTSGPSLTLPLGVHAHVRGNGAPALIIDEAAVT
ncbi:MAG: LD-carboxypeptidase [Acidobacteria bacterium]|nr:LD-carboxypeptidase [Acidobacteriota bacterium]